MSTPAFPSRTRGKARPACQRSFPLRPRDRARTRRSLAVERLLEQVGRQGRLVRMVEDMSADLERASKEAEPDSRLSSVESKDDVVRFESQAVREGPFGAFVQPFS